MAAAFTMSSAKMSFMAKHSDVDAQGRLRNELKTGVVFGPTGRSPMMTAM